MDFWKCVIVKRVHWWAYVFTEGGGVWKRAYAVMPDEKAVVRDWDTFRVDGMAACMFLCVGSEYKE